MKISVCMAAYKGEKYIASQINSILTQLSEEDELIVSDDEPFGETEKIVKEFAKNDPRVRYLEGPSKGVIKNFENALKAATGDIIFLSDQDDIWFEGKVRKVLFEFENGAGLVLHDAKVTDADLRVTTDSYFEKHKSRQGFLNNIVRNSYMGCCMAFRKEVLEKALPFPEKIPMHDQWIGLIAEKSEKISFLREPLILYRQHGNNVTGGKVSIKQKLQWRYNIIKSLMTKLN